MYFYCLIFHADESYYAEMEDEDEVIEDKQGLCKQFNCINNMS